MSHIHSQQDANTMATSSSDTDARMQRLQPIVNGISGILLFIDSLMLELFLAMLIPYRITVPQHSIIFKSTEDYIQKL